MRQYDKPPRNDARKEMEGIVTGKRLGGKRLGKMGRVSWTGADLIGADLIGVDKNCRLDEKRF